MISVNVNAGLANQMFHYAFGRGLINKGYDVFFDQINFRYRKEWIFENIRLQDAFPNIEIKEMPKGKFKWICIHETNKVSKGLRLIMINFHNLIGDEKYIFETDYGYISDIEGKITKNCILKGFWQSEKYFAHCKDAIRKQFSFLPFDEKKNIAIMNKMEKENSVAIHLRKGADYLQSELMGKGLCGVEYYIKAIEYIKQNVDNPVFYVFTDNPEWVKNNLPKFDYILVDWNEVAGKKNFRDMQLMSCAKHNIIANSTYSWWGAWLNPNPNKIVIGPTKFFNPINKFFSSSDIMCEDWVRI